MTSPLLMPMEKARSPPSSRMARPAATARSASSSWAVGTPKTAMSESPMYLSTVPPWSATTSAEAAEGGVDGAGHGLGVGALGQRGEADDVGEEHGGQLALVDGRGGAASAPAERPGRTARRSGGQRG